MNLHQWVKVAHLTINVFHLKGRLLTEMLCRHSNLEKKT